MKQLENKQGPPVHYMRPHSQEWNLHAAQRLLHAAQPAPGAHKGRAECGGKAPLLLGACFVTTITLSSPAWDLVTAADVNRQTITATPHTAHECRQACQDRVREGQSTWRSTLRVSAPCPCSPSRRAHQARDRGHSAASKVGSSPAEVGPLTSGLK